VFGFVDRLFWAGNTGVCGLRAGEFQDSNFGVSGRLSSLGYRGRLIASAKLILDDQTCLWRRDLVRRLRHLCACVSKD
jgi:hypothetical protein